MQDNDTVADKAVVGAAAVNEPNALIHKKDQQRQPEIELAYWTIMSQS